MLVEDLYDFLVDRGFNQMATDLNRAAGLYADAMADAEPDPRELGQPPEEPEDVPDPDDG